MNNAELIKALREVANWIVAMSYNSEYAHDGLKMLHYEDSIRAAADTLEAAEKRVAELEAQMPKEGKWIATSAEVDGSRFTGERCSRCGWWKSMGIYHYCPNCGAKMKGENDGES